MAGWTTQAAFLLSCGLERHLHALTAAAGDNQAAATRLAAEAKRLLLPGEMGEKFKVLALSKGFDEELLGFALDNRAHQL